MATATNQTASYKGRKYRCLFIGETKYGRRAHLQFFDGTKDFWVDASLVSVSEGGSGERSSRGGHVCAECGRPGRLVADLEDGMMKHYNCCDIPPNGY